MFNCTSDRFVDLRTQVIVTVHLNEFMVIGNHLQLSLIETGELQLNTFVAIQLALDLRKATNLTHDLYGADVLITYDLITALLKYEATLFGLNLTHSQDKDYIAVSFYENGKKNKLFIFFYF